MRKIIFRGHAQRAFRPERKRRQGRSRACPEFFSAKNALASRREEPLPAPGNVRGRKGRTSGNAPPPEFSATFPRRCCRSIARKDSGGVKIIFAAKTRSGDIEIDHPGFDDPRVHSENRLRGCDSFAPRLITIPFFPRGALRRSSQCPIHAPTKRHSFAMADANYRLNLSRRIWQTSTARGMTRKLVRPSQLVGMKFFRRRNQAAVANDGSKLVKNARFP